MITGRFYFRITNSGNLIGEFSNNGLTVNSTESADRKASHESNSNSFEGQFHSSWQEDGEAFYADLTIAPKTGTTNILTLIWSRGKKTIFWGEGFLAEGLLIGNYQDKQIP